MIMTSCLRSLFLLLIVSSLMEAAAQSSGPLLTTASSWPGPAASINQMATAPAIDGRMKTDEWSSASVLPLTALKGVEPTPDWPLRTNFPDAWMGWDETALYLAVPVPSHSDDACVQLWVDPEGQGAQSTGFSLDGAGGKSVILRGGALSPPAWKGEVGRGLDERWFEMAVPLKYLDAESTVGARVALNVAVYTGMGATEPAPWRAAFWAQSGGDPGWPGRFGAVCLERAAGRLEGLRLFVDPESIRLRGEWRSFEGAGFPPNAVLKVMQGAIAIGEVTADLQGGALDVSVAPKVSGPLLCVLSIEKTVGEGEENGDGALLRFMPLPVSVPEAVDRKAALKELARRVDDLPELTNEVGLRAARRYQGARRVLEKLLSESQRILKLGVAMNGADQRREIENLEIGLMEVATDMREAYVFPQPRRMDATPANYHLKAGATLWHTSSLAVAEIAAMLQADISGKISGVELPLAAMPKEERPALVIGADKFKRAPKSTPLGQGAGYRLWVDKEGVYLVGEDLEGLWLATRTLIQLIRPAPQGRIMVPGLTIEDWPAFSMRAVALDTDGMQTLDAAAMEAMIRRLSDLKYNYLFLKSRTRYLDPLAGALTSETGVLSSDDLIALCAKGRERRLHIVPYIDCMGQMDDALSGERAALRENPTDSSTIAILDEKAESVIDKRIESVVKMHSERFVHLGGRGGTSLIWGGYRNESRELVRQHGAAALLERQFNRLDTLAWRRHKTPLFWADTILARPSALNELDRRALFFVNGGPVEEARFQVAMLRSMGFPTMIYVEIDEPGLIQTSRRFNLVERAMDLAREQKVPGVCLSLLANAEQTPMDASLMTLVWGAECISGSPRIRQQFFLDKYGRQEWKMDLTATMNHLMDPPLLRFGAGEPQRLAQSLLSASIREVALFMDRVDDRDVLVEEANRVFSQTTRRLITWKEVEKENDVEDPILTFHRLMLRINRALAMKILAIEGIRREYLSAYAAYPAGSAREMAMVPSAAIDGAAQAVPHGKALLYDHPYLIELYEKQVRTRGWNLETLERQARRDAEDAARIHAFLERNYKGLVDERPLDSPQTMAFAPSGSAERIGQWPLSDVVDAEAAGRHVLSAEWSGSVNPGETEYFVLKVKGATDLIVESVRALELSPTLNRENGVVLFSRKENREVSDGVPFIFTWTPEEQIRNQTFRIEIHIAGALPPYHGRIYLLKGKFGE